MRSRFFSDFPRQENLPEILACRANLRGLRVVAAALRLRNLTLRAGFNPNQPRTPRGNGDESGRWTDRRVAINIDIPPRSATGKKGPRLKPPEPPPLRGLGDNGGPPLEDPPTFSRERPPAASQRNQVAKAIARWVVKAAARRALGPLGLFLDAMEVIGWLNEIYPDIQSYFDAPKSLDELQRLVRDPQPGYEIHHIVEKKPAADDGYPQSMIEAPENLVRIPKLKHHQITGWYNGKQPELGYTTPRQYLHRKNWQERRAFGLEQLIKAGVMTR